MTGAAEVSCDLESLPPSLQPASRAGGTRRRPVDPSRVTVWGICGVLACVTRLPREVGTSGRAHFPVATLGCREARVCASRWWCEDGVRAEKSVRWLLAWRFICGFKFMARTLLD